MQKKERTKTKKRTLDQDLHEEDQARDSLPFSEAANFFCIVAEEPVSLRLALLSFVCLFFVSAFILSLVCVILSFCRFLKSNGSTPSREARSCIFP